MQVRRGSEEGNDFSWIREGVLQDIRFNDASDSHPSNRPLSRSSSSSSGFEETVQVRGESEEVITPCYLDEFSSSLNEISPRDNKDNLQERKRESANPEEEEDDDDDEPWDEEDSGDDDTDSGDSGENNPWDEEEDGPNNSDSTDSKSEGEEGRDEDVHEEKKGSNTEMNATGDLQLVGVTAKEVHVQATEESEEEEEGEEEVWKSPRDNEWGDEEIYKAN